MTNPRKFSEKIALHNQKQAEETAAFEEIMREVMGATRPVPNETYRNQQHLHIIPSFNATRAGSLPNVNQIGQHNSDDSTEKDTYIDLQSALSNLQEIKNGCFERSGSVRAESYSSRRNVSPLSRSPHRSSSNNIAYNVNNLPFINSVLQKRSQSPYSTSNNAYLSPPPPDGHWRRTNSDSALHQSTLLSASNNQTLDGFHQITNNLVMNSGNNNNSPRRSPAMVIDNSTSPNMMNNMSNTSDNLMNGNVVAWTDQSNDNSQDKFLLSASLPDQQLRPRSCEVPGINIYPSQDDNNSADSIANHHHIPISSNTGSLPDLTNLHFPVPLHTPIDAEDQNGIQNAIMNIGATPNSPYSNGPDSPFSPTSSHNSNLSPPPPCNMMGNYSPSNQSPRRQTSPGPSPSPTASRRRPHHNVNNLVIGNHRHQVQPQVCYSRPHTPPPQPLPQNIPSSPNYLNEPNHQYSSQYQSPPKITLEGLALDTNALSLNGNGAQYKSTNMANLTSQNSSIPANSDSSIYTSASDSASFHQQPQFQFNNTQSFQNQFATMDIHRSTTPTDSCSAPTSPISQSLSPSNSPELPMNCNGGNSNVSNKQYNNSYSSYSNHQANILHQQLEQFRMTNDSDANNYMMSCNSNLTSPLDSGEQNSNVFYLSSPNTSISNVALNQYADSVISQQNNNELPSSPHQISCQTSVFSNDNVYYSSSQIPSLQNMPNNSSNLVYMKSDGSNHVDTMNNLYSNHQLSNSSHCTTPQTPTSIPDIILTGPNNLDELQSTTDFVKDLNNTIVNLNNMGSFDSDIFCSSSDDALRAGSFDSFDLDSLQILPDIDPNTE